MDHGVDLQPSEVPETMTRAIQTKNGGPNILAKKFYRQYLIIPFFAFLRHKILICIKSLSTIFCFYFYFCLVGSLKCFKTNFRNRLFLKSFSGELKGVDENEYQSALLVVNKVRKDRPNALKKSFVKASAQEPRK